jgi:hypothetical protein
MANSAAVPFEDALHSWQAPAGGALVRTARTYRAFITYKELAEEVQDHSGIRTRSLIMNWIGRVLGTVSADCHSRGEPLLSALCVREDGTVGPGYGIAVVENYGGQAPADLDARAAAERLNCYRYFGAAGLPADGGTPSLTPKVAAKRASLRIAPRRQVAEESRPLCPSCHLMLPMSGQCDNCD